MDDYLKLIGMKSEIIRKELIKTIGGDIYRCGHVFTSPRLDNSENETVFKEVISREIDVTCHEVNPLNNKMLSTKGKKVIVELYKEIVSTPGNFLLQKDAADKYGEDVINNILTAGGLYLLSGRCISKDRSKDPNTQIIVPNCPLHLSIMKKYMHKF
jgi:hypothetical protein